MEIRRSVLLEFSAEEIFDIIEGAEHYPAFLPGCESVTILERTDTVIAATVTVGWKGLRFSFTTRNPKRRPEWLAVRLDRREAPDSKSGAFKLLDGEWNIRALSPRACKVEFTLRCELEGAIARKLAGVVFETVADTLMNAYVARAQALHYAQPT
ncbi:MAG TPA: type II toxin-antitoxin system RatA family toxin [Usitatibacter sp.]|nr:type II toxin-antitoxin system RatA family toxin [Usitatibacter sp.]